MLDYDFDGLLDLFVTNGHVEDRTWNGRGEPFQMRPQLYRNMGGGKFSETSSSGGQYFQEAWLGRGVAVADLNRDRQPDLIVAHQLTKPAVLLRQNQSMQPIVIELVGTRSNRNALGAAVSVLSASGELRAFRELSAGTSFESSQENKLFLMGQTGDKLKIRWPSGEMQMIDFPDSPHAVIIEP
jgi:hypothetical protein